MNNHELLLKRTSEIIKQFYHQRNNNGELFNLYSLLGIEHRENETHSVLLADLLSPKGSHGQKDKFLQLFFETLGVKVENTEFAKVSREYYIGKIDDNYTKGGRIDILIEIGEKKWLIENKLYAPDQKNQLERYHQKFPNATIIYLTLDGKEYYQKVDFDIGYISYEITIIKWLEKIQNEINNKEYLSNSIKQYFNLIKNITFNGFTQEMEKNIQDKIIKSAENLESAFEIYNNYENAIKRLLSNNLIKLDQILLKLHLDEILIDNENRYYRKKTWDDGIYIGLEFEKGFPNNLFTGITIKNTENPKLREYLRKTYDFSSSEIWPAYNVININIYSQNAKVFFDNSFLELIVIDLKIYIEVLDDIHS